MTSKSSDTHNLRPRQKMYSTSSKRKSSREGGDAAEKRSAQRARDKQAREGLVVWRDPVWTLYYFLIECLELATTYIYKFFTSTRCLSTVAAIALSYYIGKNVPALESTFTRVEDKFAVCLWWVTLGVLSSVGLGTGLHTFLLYLGPFIAKVTMAAYECGSTDFPEPPYPDEVVCPDRGAEGFQAMAISIFTIMSKVRLESFMWGAGTALGELPPYFMARAARLAGQDLDDQEDDDEFASEMKEALEEADTSTLFGKGKAFMHNLVNRAGFFGILLAASIPNPLFDLAGITCGHFLIPFWTFFGATLIGKAVVKMHIQMCFIIFLFSKHHIKTVVDLLSFAPSVQRPFEEFLDKQSSKFHNPSEADGESEGGGSIVKNAFEYFVVAMLGYFIVSIVNSMAQSQLKKRQKKAQ